MRETQGLAKHAHLLQLHRSSLRLGVLRQLVEFNGHSSFQSASRVLRAFELGIQSLRGVPRVEQVRRVEVYLAQHILRGRIFVQQVANSRHGILSLVSSLIDSWVGLGVDRANWMSTKLGSVGLAGVRTARDPVLILGLSASSFPYRSLNIDFPLHWLWLVF